MMISKRLDHEIEPFKPISKDHLRTNRVGMNLEKLEALEKQPKHFKKERQSLDMSQMKTKKKFTEGKSFHSRKMS